MVHTLCNAGVGCLTALMHILHWQQAGSCKLSHITTETFWRPLLHIKGTKQ